MGIWEKCARVGKKKREEEENRNGRREISEKFSTSTLLILLFQRQGTSDGRKEIVFKENWIWKHKVAIPETAKQTELYITHLTPFILYLFPLPSTNKFFWSFFSIVPSLIVSILTKAPQFKMYALINGASKSKWPHTRFDLERTRETIQTISTQQSYCRWANWGWERERNLTEAVLWHSGQVFVMAVGLAELLQ